MLQLKKKKIRSTSFSLSEKQKSIIWLNSIIKLAWHDTLLYCILSNFLLSSNSTIILSFKYCSKPWTALKSIRPLFVLTIFIISWIVLLCLLQYNNVPDRYTERQNLPYPWNAGSFSFLGLKLSYRLPQIKHFHSCLHF